MDQYLAQRIYHKGKVYPLSVLRISKETSEIEIFPFSEEIHSTVYINGSIYVLSPEARDKDELKEKASVEYFTRQNLWYEKERPNGSADGRPVLLFV